MAKLTGWGIVLIAALAIILIPGLRTTVLGGLNLGGGTTVINNGGTGGVPVIQTTPDTTTVKFLMYDQYAPATELTGQNVTVYAVDGGKSKLGKIAEGGTTTVSPGDTLELEWGTTDEAPANGYYAVKETKAVPNTKGQFNLQTNLAAVSTAPTLTFFDENGNSATALALTNGDVYVAEYKVKAEANKCYGNAATGKKNAACFKYNTTEISSIKLGSAATTSVPQTVTNVTSGWQWSCYEFEPVCDNLNFRGNVEITMASGDSPDGESPSIAVCLEDTAFYKNADNDLLEVGYTDENNNALGATIVCDSIDVS